MPGLAIVTFSGHRQANVRDSADFRVWSAIADQLDAVHCFWSGPELHLVRDQWHVVRKPRGSGVLAARWGLTAVWAGLAAVRAEKKAGHVVLLNGADPWGWFAACTVSYLTRCRWVMDVHADYLAVPPASVGRRRALLLPRVMLFFARRADERRVVSEGTRDRFGDLGLTSVLVPPRLQRVWEQPLARRLPPQPTLLTVGRLVRSKGYDMLLQAVADVRPRLPGLTLRLVGDGPQRVPLEAQAAELGLGSAVTFVGAGDVSVVRDELARCTAFVISSRDEGLPRTLLEAVAAEVPVISTDVGGIRVAVSGLPVRVVPPTMAALAHGIAATVAAPPAKQDLEAARRRVLQDYGFDRNVKALCSLFTAVARWDDSAEYGSPTAAETT